ncbi:MAG: hypothetical protein ACP5EP_01920 [Acidobacteriaceae bacterium]
MPLLSLRTARLRRSPRGPEQGRDFPEGTQGGPLGERLRLAGNEREAGPHWDRNLSWEQRERLRHGRELLPMEDGPVFTPMGRPQEEEAPSGALPFFATCMNPRCETNWLRLWRRRQAPRLEGEWACSPECMQALVENAVAREMSDMAGETGRAAQPHRHRLPMGLLLLAQGWITEEQLRNALEAQRTVGKGRIGAWLMRQCHLPEERVTRALGIQWGSPVLSVTSHQPESVATLVPRLLLDTFGILPVRVASGRVLYMGFEDRIDAAAALAVERMSGLRVETGVVTASQYLRAHERMMAASFPKATLTEAGSASAVVEILTAAIERVRPHEARLVRMHQYFWLRMWRTPFPGIRAMQTAAAAPGQAGRSAQARPLAAPIPRLHQVEDLLCHYRPTEGQRPA